MDFLTARLNNPNFSDCKMLSRVICCLRATKDFPLTLEVTKVNIIKWWVDASFVVPNNMKSHRFGMMSLGEGAMQSNSS